MIRNSAEKLFLRYAVVVVVAQHVIKGTIETLQFLFNGGKKSKRFLFVWRFALVLQITKFDQEVDFLLVHQLNTLRNLVERVAVIPVIFRRSVGVVRVRYDTESDGFNAGGTHRRKRA